MKCFAGCRIAEQWRELSRTINENIRQNGRLPTRYNKGDKVRRDVDGKVYVVKRSYWQSYGDGPGDWTVELESIVPSQPTPWDKSTNLESVGKHPCPYRGCGADNEIVNQCGCDPNNMPTKLK